MTRDPGSRSALLQVAALAVLAVIASQIVTFVVILTSPPPRPAGFSIGAAATALSGEPARTADGRVLTRKLSDRPLVQTDPKDGLARLIAGTLARSMDVSADRVRVAVSNAPGPPGMMMNQPGTIVRETRGFVRGPDGPGTRAPAPAAPVARVMTPPPPGLAEALAGAIGRPDVQVFMAGSDDPRFTILADRLTFQPFSASVRLDDGRWATVRPPRGLIEPWQARLLASLGISLVLLAPIVWLLARRLTRPIRAFAEAAQRLGADPDAEPLKPSGPAEVRTAIAAFNDMQASLRDHMRKRTQTIAAIAHDLRTPLTRLRFRAEQAPDALRDRMAADVEEMDALIGQAMAFVRGETTPDRRERFDLTVLVRDCAAGFSETGAPVGFEGDATLPVDGDPVALRRAVANLIDNAVKFAGGARVRAFTDPGHAVVTVDDDGPGLPETELDAVFEPFHRGERSRSRETGGAGLGLAVARQSARAAGGDVGLTNREGGGLEARLFLPLAG